MRNIHTNGVSSSSFTMKAGTAMGMLDGNSSKPNLNEMV